MKKKWLYIAVAILVVLFIVVSVLIEGPNKKRMYLKIKKDSIPSELHPGDVFTIELDTNLYKTNIRFDSTDTDIAVVNNEGLVTLLKKGEVIIYVSSVYEEKNPQQTKVKLKVK